MVPASPAVMVLSLTGLMAHKKDVSTHLLTPTSRLRMTATHLAANPSAGTPTASRIQGVRSYVNMMGMYPPASKWECSPALATWR